MTRLWKDLPEKIHHKVSENWISTILLLAPVIGTYSTLNTLQLSYSQVHDEEEDHENESEGSYSESEASVDHHGNNISPDDLKARSSIKRSDTLSSESKSPKGSMKPQVTKKLSSRPNRSSLPRHDVASAMKEPSALSNASGESKRQWGRAHFSSSCVTDADRDCVQLRSRRQPINLTSLVFESSSYLAGEAILRPEEFPCYQELLAHIQFQLGKFRLWNISYVPLGGNRCAHEIALSVTRDQ
ncbi:unnamed protein product [Eruca vesicaria subsp. sativa]|uniref:RNase H type-1 domain-containing protein n=1 Tax=Eruca vesicaria subsp. sativa TaxID=29727 RepID=A0ABC8J131_ERUVS|nr:unnamed protein product [Eruca vesicaria subsp. sativa]